MKDRVFVYSTLTSAMEYRETLPGGGDVPVIGRTVTIQGGTNIPNRQLVTPRGVVTPIDAADLAWLEENPVFAMHLKNGFITVSAAEEDAEKVAADMTGRDQSAPLVEADFRPGHGPVGSDAEPAAAAAPARRASSRRA